MLLNNAPVNEAVLSNVGEIGEFRIRNSAKAFNILSSGLYANKIRAIIRELSCNAVDSHVAAGRAETPFDIHLPNQLEPWFAIRDYGTGLSHEQVTSIYTTYFESTKTDSNDFIGALGLGSKSPFSYTDNFTVTAIKDNRKGIYSAFINGEGVPSIALMMEEATSEPSGVEVKFSVNDRWDFSKFQDEARHVYRYFSLRPVVTGAEGFQFRDTEYVEKDIIPGVHTMSGGRGSIAVMGNIAYPIDVPNAEKNLGKLYSLLNCSLEINFAIGEVDFQASREGLSYIPQTIDAIKAKLEALNAQLATHLGTKAKEFTNEWDRAIWLEKKRNESLWSSAAIKYVVDTKDPMFDLTAANSYNYGRLLPFKIYSEELRKKYNVIVRAFSKSRGSNTCSNYKEDYEYDNTTKINSHYWRFPVQDGVFFVKNDTKIGAVERAKYHWRTLDAKDLPYSSTVFVIEAYDKTKPVKFDAFLKALKSPPKVMVASQLAQKERAQNSGSAKNVSILRLEERGTGGYYRSKELVWRDAGKASEYATQTVYYLPLSGYNVISKLGVKFSAKDFFEDLKRCGFGALRVPVLGVRKGDIEFIKTQKNWINIEDMVISTLANATDEQKLNLAHSSVDRGSLMSYNKTIVDSVENKMSPYVVFANKISKVEKVDYTEFSLRRLCNNFEIGLCKDIDSIKDSLVKESTAVYNRYPLLGSLDSCKAHGAIAEYINMIDTKKGV